MKHKIIKNLKTIAILLGIFISLTIFAYAPIFIVMLTAGILLGIVYIEIYNSL